MIRSLRTTTRGAFVGALGLVVAGCTGPLDYDLRGVLGGGLDTSGVAVMTTAPRPEPDRRGIISYPNYQVALARRGDTLQDVASRIGMDADELARHNGISAKAELRSGEVIALPGRVAEPSAATGGTGVILPPSNVDISSLAGSAIDRAEPAVTSESLPAAPNPKSDGQTGLEPLRHKVQRGETAFTIARLYNVSVRSLSEWNGLGTDFTIRENQILLIPPAAPSTSKSGAAATAAAATATTAPGVGTPTPTPPSSTQPLPKDTSPQKIEKPESPDLSKTQTTTSTKMAYPVKGKLVRPYTKGKNNGIDISAAAGSAVSAATDGKVAAITKDADNVTIVVLRHPDNVMTVYYNVDGVKVSKGDAVKRGQTIAAVPKTDSYVHFEVRKGFESVDPMPYLK